MQTSVLTKVFAFQFLYTPWTMCMQQLDLLRCGFSVYIRTASHARTMTSVDRPCQKR